MLTTVQAAAKANRTVATIRHWCRYGAVTARKIAGRWAISATSLEHRISIGTRRRQPATTAITVDALIAIGGRYWSKGGHQRVYINNWADFLGLEVHRYKTGMISSAAFDGHAIANGRATDMLTAIDHIYYDVAREEFRGVWQRSARAWKVRWRDGERLTIDLVSRAVAGIREAARTAA